jgi:hypothetical protein
VQISAMGQRGQVANNFGSQRGAFLARRFGGLPEDSMDKRHKKGHGVVGGHGDAFPRPGPVEARAIARPPGRLL